MGENFTVAHKVVQMLLVTILKQFKTLAQIHLGNILNLFTNFGTDAAIESSYPSKISSKLAAGDYSKEAKNSSIDAAGDNFNPYQILV